MPSDSHCLKASGSLSFSAVTSPPVKQRAMWGHEALVSMDCLKSCLLLRLSCTGNKNPAIADGDDECYVGRWIGTIKPPCFSLAGLVLLSAPCCGHQASRQPTRTKQSPTSANALAIVARACVFIASCGLVPSIAISPMVPVIVAWTLRMRIVSVAIARAVVVSITTSINLCFSLVCHESGKANHEKKWCRCCEDKWCSFLKASHFVGVGL